MSTISNENNRRDDTVRRVKDEYYAKEAEENRKHKAELRGLTEKFQNEIEDLKSDNEAKIAQIQGYMRTRYDKQEKNHQDQVQEIRDLYTQQLRKKSEESQYLKEEQKNSYENAFQKQKTLMENQKARLETQFSNDLKEKEDAFQNYAQFAKDAGRKTWDERRERLQKNTEDQLNRERENHDRQLAAVNRDLSEVKKTKDSELQLQKSNNEYERSRLILMNRDNKEAQEKINASVHESMAHDVQSQQQLMKQKFREEVDTRVAEVEKNQKDFVESTSDRLNRKLTGLKSELKNEKNERVIEKTSLKRQAELEKRHVISDYEKNLADERYQKEEVLASVNDEVDKEVTKAVQTRDQILKDISDAHLREREMKRAEGAAQMSQMKNEMQAKEEHVTLRADAKVNRANELVRQNNVRMQKFYGDNLELIKKEYMKELNDERIRHIEERSEIESRLEGKIRERERSLTGELDQKIVGYEDRIEAQKEKFADEIRRLKDEQAELIQARDRSYREGVKSIEMKYQNQLRQTKESYANEMDSMDRRHREEMNQLAQKMTERQKRS